VKFGHIFFASRFSYNLFTLEVLLGFKKSLPNITYNGILIYFEALLPIFLPSSMQRFGTLLKSYWFDKKNRVVAGRQRPRARPRGRAVSEQIMGWIAPLLPVEAQVWGAEHFHVPLEILEPEAQAVLAALNDNIQAQGDAQADPGIAGVPAPPPAPGPRPGGGALIFLNPRHSKFWFCKF